MAQRLRVAQALGSLPGRGVGQFGSFSSVLAVKLLNSIRMLSTIQQRWNACRVHSAAAELSEQLTAASDPMVGDASGRRWHSAPVGPSHAPWPLSRRPSRVRLGRLGHRHRAGGPRALGVLASLARLIVAASMLAYVCDYILYIYIYKARRRSIDRSIINRSISNLNDFDRWRDRSISRWIDRYQRTSTIRNTAPGPSDCIYILPPAQAWCASAAPTRACGVRPSAHRSVYRKRSRPAIALGNNEGAGRPGAPTMASAPLIGPPRSAGEGKCIT